MEKAGKFQRAHLKNEVRARSTAKRRNEGQGVQKEPKGVKRLRKSNKRREKTSVACDGERVCLGR